MRAAAHAGGLLAREFRNGRGSTYTWTFPTVSFAEGVRDER